MELWHVLYRGVDGRSIFSDNQDRARFIHDLFEFNNTAPAEEYQRSIHVYKHKQNVRRATSHMREGVVSIHGWKLMENHVHLILSEQVEKGLSLFLRKMSGYGRYYNDRHHRRGTLFDRTKKVPIQRQEHFLYILHYIHLNGLDNFPGAQNWRERDIGTIPDVDTAFAHLLSDRWSSVRDYCGHKNFPSILNKKPFENCSGEYEADLRSFMEDRSLEYISGFVLE